MKKLYNVILEYEYSYVLDVVLLNDEGDLVLPPTFEIVSFFL